MTNDILTHTERMRCADYSVPSSAGTYIYIFRTLTDKEMTSCRREIFQPCLLNFNVNTWCVWSNGQDPVVLGSVHLFPYLYLACHFSSVQDTEASVTLGLTLWCWWPHWRLDVKHTHLVLKLYCTQSCHYHYLASGAATWGHVVQIWSKNHLDRGNNLRQLVSKWESVDKYPS